MNSSFKGAARLIFSLALATSIYAGIDNRLDRLEREMQDVAVYNQENTLGARFVTARPIVRGTQWFATFDLVYWQTKLGGTEYAYSCEPTPSLSGSAPLFLPVNVKGQVKSNGFDWDYGLKVGVGYKTLYGSWDLYARYTYFATHDSDASTKVPPAALIPLTTFDLIAAQKIKSHVDVDYNNLELELARSFFLSKYLAVRPHIDLKTTWIDISQDVTITASSIGNTNQTIGLDYKTKGKSDFWGMGPQVGFDSKWILGDGFHLFGDVAGSILYGYFKTQEQDFFPPSATPGIPKGEILKLSQKFHRLIPFVQMFLGLGWETYTPEKSWHISLKLGYEVQYYWRVNQITESENGNIIVGSSSSERLLFEKSSEDLMFYGLTGGARFDF